MFDVASECFPELSMERIDQITLIYITRTCLLMSKFIYIYIFIVELQLVSINI